jgi:hypothetical protein
MLHPLERQGTTESSAVLQNVAVKKLKDYRINAHLPENLKHILR